MAGLGQHNQNGTAGDATSEDWWTEIIHQHQTLLTSHSRILSAILKTSSPASARHDTITKYLAHTTEMLGQVGIVETGGKAKRRRSDEEEVPRESGVKRRNVGEGEEAELLSPSLSPSEEEGKAASQSVPSHSVPVQSGKKVRRVESTSPRGRKVEEVDDFRVEVEARLKAKEKAKAKLKDGSKKRRRRSSTLEAEERRREKRVKRESFGERKRGSPEAEEEGRERRKRRRRVT